MTNRREGGVGVGLDLVGFALECRDGIGQRRLICDLRRKIIDHLLHVGDLRLLCLLSRGDSRQNGRIVGFDLFDVGCNFTDCCDCFFEVHACTLR